MDPIKNDQEEATMQTPVEEATMQTPVEEAKKKKKKKKKAKAKAKPSVSELEKPVSPEEVKTAKLEVQDQE